MGTIVSEVTWRPAPWRSTLLQCTISGIQEETGVSACGGRNLLKGATTLHCFRADGAKIPHGAKNKYL